MLTGCFCTMCHSKDGQSGQEGWEREAGGGNSSPKENQVPERGDQSWHQLKLLLSTSFIPAQPSVCVPSHLVAHHVASPSFSILFLFPF